MKFYTRDWEPRLVVPILSRTQAALHVSRHTRHRFNLVDALGLVGLVVAALVAVGAVLP